MKFLQKIYSKFRPKIEVSRITDSREVADFSETRDTGDKTSREMEMENEKQFKKLLIKGKCVVFVDWANVHGWEKSLRQFVDIRKLFSYLSKYKEIEDIRLYFGTDRHEKSTEFL